MKTITSFFTGLLIGLIAANAIAVQTTNANISAASFFRDVRGSEFFDLDGSVMAMVAKGIVKGYEDGRFAGNDPVTRGQAVVMMRRYHDNVVRPLQQKVEYLLHTLELGICGDKVLHKQQGEECDDGNTVDGDGCSAECLQEVMYQPVRDREDCNEREMAFNIFVDEHQFCRSDAECTIVHASCPLLTCGSPISTSALPEAELLAREYTECVQASGEPMACAGCAPLPRVVCLANRCVFQDSQVPEGDMSPGKQEVQLRM